MTIASVIKKFSDRERVPVDVNDIVAELRARGVTDEIYFWEPDIKSEKLKGQLVHYETWTYPAGPDGEAGPIVRVADIYCAKNLSIAWKRVVSCKELLHILDPAQCHAATEAEVTSLFEKMALPADMQDPLNDGDAANTDRLALFQAVAILFPYATRNLLLPHYPGTFTVQDIARMVDLPPRFVFFVMHEIWDEVFKILTAE